MANRLTSQLAKKLFLKALGGLEEGSLEVVCPEATYSFGRADDPLRATIAVHDEAFFANAVIGGDVGMGEAYVQGQWSTPDLVSVVRVGVRNLEVLDRGSRMPGLFRRAADFWSHRRNRNSVTGSRRNIAYHYDLGNEFYRLFLDATLAYSCAYYEGPEDSLEAAQIRKFDRICRKLQIGPQDHVLEIGTGWGGFAAYAAQHCGCRVTTTTISRQQFEYARALLTQSGMGKQVDLLFEDYRNLHGRYDKIVSIEMFEAVGHQHYDDYFGACDRLLTENGSMLLQTITMREAKFAAYLKQSDWIKKHIFPGAELASVGAIVQSLKRCTRMQMFDLEDIGVHYALTLREWRRRFHENLAAVRKLGFDETFMRMWDYYLAYCEGAFLERYIGDVQIVLSKVTNRTRLWNEPGSVAGALDEVRRPVSLPARL